MSNPIPPEVATSTEPVALFGYAVPLPGREQELADTLRSFLEPTRAEDGAVAYEIHEVPGRPGVIGFYEHWASGIHLSRHLALPVMQEFLERRHELLEGDLQITFLTPIPA